MKKINYQILNVFEGINLVDNVIQTLPAYLSFSFIIDAQYQIVLTSPDEENAGELSGYSYLGTVNHWRIPLVKEGKWSLAIDYKGDLSSQQEIISLEVPIELFDVICEEEEEDDYLHEISCSLPSQDEIQYVDISSRLKELDAHWLEVNSEMKLWRYIHDDTSTPLSEEEWAVPFLFVHGFNSDYTTWNWMVRYLWVEGFRHIFGVNLFDDALGVEENAKKIHEVINEILEMCNEKNLYFFGHSLGGLIGRYYVKKIDPLKIKLMISMASPHLSGLNRLFGKIFIILKKNAQLTERDVTLQPESSVTEVQTIVTESDFYQQTMVNICGTLIRGGDGGFKLKDNLVPDMINLGVSAFHTSVNKHEDTYKIIRNLIFGNSVVYKIRLLYIVPSGKAKQGDYCLYIKPSNQKEYHRYPTKKYLQLGEEEPYISQEPLIVFTSLSSSKQASNERIEIQIRDYNNKIINTKEFVVPFGTEKPISDHFQLESSIGYLFQFAVYSYKI